MTSVFGLLIEFRSRTMNYLWSFGCWKCCIFVFIVCFVDLDKIWFNF